MNAISKADTAIQLRQRVNDYDAKLEDLLRWGYSPDSATYRSLAAARETTIALAWQYWDEFMSGEATE